MNDWLPELIEKIGRSEELILRHGLFATDFSGRVEIRLPYGATYCYTLAFAVIRPDSNLAAVFTEHAGYIEFDLEEDCVVAEIHEDIYRQR